MRRVKTTGRLPVACAALFALIACAAPARPAPAPLDNAACLECHAATDLTTKRPDGTEVSLAVAETLYAASVHGQAGLACTDCHSGIADLPHDEELPAVSCGDCHSDALSAYAGSVHGVAAAAGDRAAPMCIDCHGTHGILPSASAESPTHKSNQPSLCATCHSDPAVVARHGISAHAPLDAYLRSVHGRTLLVEKNEAAPTCATCHGAHDTRSSEDPASHVYKARVPETCGACHSREAAAYSQSVHGVAVARGNPDAPACNDCHGEHQIEPPSSPTSLVYPKTLAETTCTRCHENLILAQRYGFPPDRGATFRQTYHGLATQLGGLPVANCASCHGIHDILPSSDDRSTINPANLQATCGHCHPDASEAFTKISVHEPATIRPQHPVVRVARSTYIVLLVTVIGGMAVHNLLIWAAFVARKLRRERAVPQVRRFSRLEVFEHVLLIVTFFGLVVTGFALKYSGAFWVGWLTRLGFDETVRGVAHRVFGILLIALGVAHAVLLLGTRRGRREIGALRPARRDLAELVGTFAHYFGKSGPPPRPGRYTYAEKAEYLALIWGTAIMAVTGLALWFPTVVTRWGPAWLVEVSEVVHFYEAWLAFLAIIVWHWFFTIFHPEEYPLNLTFLHGKVTAERAAERDSEGDSDPESDAERDGPGDPPERDRDEPR
jgi:cytochrome b subunit of formate dehydrogenase